MSGDNAVQVKAEESSPKLLPVQTNLAHESDPSPRSSSSAEQHQSPRSPFLQHLHHRFRKGSVASSSVTSSEPGTPSSPADPVDKTEAAQAAKRFLIATIRNDWQWPPEAEEVREDLKEAAHKKEEALSAREPMAWRTRQEGQSDRDIDSDKSMTGRRRKRNSDPYRFENPDAIAASIAEKRLRRKRKIEEEMQWNEGLKTWSERRDAWTAAVQTPPSRESSDETVKQDETHEIATKKRPLSITNSITKTLQGAKLRHHSHGEGSVQEESPERPESQQASSSATNTPTMSSFPDSTSTSASSIDPDVNAPYLPVFPPLFPVSHTLRARIKPPAYPTIYSKVVIQSLTPNVPIPLAHMIGALVDGWKSEGNWPPQAAAAEAAATLQQNRKYRGDGAFTRWRREQDEKRRLKNVSAVGELGAHGHGILKDIVPVEDGDVERKGFRKSLSGAVKKVFGMHDGEHDEDGGLERMGVRFLDQQELDAEDENLHGVQGLMEEAKSVMDDNVTLNKGLVEAGS